MSKVLIITKGKYSRLLIQKVISSQISQNEYDIISDDTKLIKQFSKNEYPDLHISFYQTEFQSSKVKGLIERNFYQHITICLNKKSQMIDCIHFIRDINKRTNINFLHKWQFSKKLKALEDDQTLPIHLHDIISNKLLNTIPNIPVFAENVGLGNREIMEVTIPLESGFIYKHLSAIKQNNFSIAAIYRGNRFILPKANLMIHPNDRLLLIGHQNTLENIHQAINNIKSPFKDSKNIYIIIDMEVLTPNDIFSLIKKGISFYKKFSLKQVIIKVINPTDIGLLDQMKKIHTRYIDLRIDYHKKTNLSSEIKRSSISLIITHKKSFDTYKKLFLHLKIPLLITKKHQHTNNIFITLNEKNITHYESISSMAFHFCKHLKLPLQMYSFDPDGENHQQKEELIEHYQMLSTIFKQTPQVIKATKNPIIEIKNRYMPQGQISSQKAIQILPMSKQIVYTKKIKALFLKNSDYLYTKFDEIDQLFLPV